MKAIIQNETVGFSKWVRKMGKDKRLLATHISLFTALFIHFQKNDFISPFSVSRKTLMAFSRIASIVTYHKCIKELDTYGYIIYQPSYHPTMGSLVYWQDLENAGYSKRSGAKPRPLETAADSKRRAVF